MTVNINRDYTGYDMLEFCQTAFREFTLKIPYMLMNENTLDDLVAKYGWMDQYGCKIYKIPKDKKKSGNLYIQNSQIILVEGMRDGVVEFR